VRKAPRECPDCPEVGAIVDCGSSTKYLHIKRKCANIECFRGKEAGIYTESLDWNHDYITVVELDECRKWLEKTLENLQKKGEKRESIPAYEGQRFQSMKCWKEDCDKPLQACRYPFYICNNKHVVNIETGETWFWKGTDEEFHRLRRLESCLKRTNGVLEREKQNEKKIEPND